MQPQLCNNFRYWVFFSPKLKKNSSFLLHWTESDSLFFYFKWSNFIQHIGILRFVLFVRKGKRNQEQMLSHMECCWLCVCVFTRNYCRYFQWKKKWNENVIPSVFRDLKRTCPSWAHTHPLSNSNNPLVMCLISDRNFVLLILPFFLLFFRLGRCTRLVCACRREREKGHWNVFVEQQIYFLIPKFCLSTVSFIFFRTQRNCLKIAMATD